MFSMRHAVIGLGCLVVAGSVAVATENPKDSPRSVDRLNNALSHSFKGLRCEFCGYTSFQVQQGASEVIGLKEKWIIRNCGVDGLLGAKRINDIYDKGKGGFVLNGFNEKNNYKGDWVWVHTDVESITLTLTPDENARYIYFYNIFNKPLFFYVSENTLSLDLEKCLKHLSPTTKEKNGVCFRRYKLDPGQNLNIPLQYLKDTSLVLKMNPND